MRIYFAASQKPDAQRAVALLKERCEQSDLWMADVVVAVGGDGTALNALRMTRAARRQPVFAMRTGDSVGALANPFRSDDLRQDSG